MRSAAVIGAGTTGLYTAIKLDQAGVKNIVVYDPRAGNYNRPGHLHDDVFIEAQNGLGITFWSFDKIGHIKDLERALYKEAQKLNITIEEKSFFSGSHRNILFIPEANEKVRRKSHHLPEHEGD